MKNIRQRLGNMAMGMAQKRIALSVKKKEKVKKKIMRMRISHSDPVIRAAMIGAKKTDGLKITYIIDEDGEVSVFTEPKGFDIDKDALRGYGVDLVAFGFRFVELIVGYGSYRVTGLEYNPVVIRERFKDRENLLDALVRAEAVKGAVS